MRNRRNGGKAGWESARSDRRTVLEGKREGPGELGSVSVVARRRGKGLDPRARELVMRRMMWPKIVGDFVFEIGWIGHGERR